MITYTCDICKKVIDNLDEIGEFVIRQKSFTFIKHKQQHNLEEKRMLLCRQCAPKVLEKMNEIAKELAEAKKEDEAK